jgi:SAM-dependent methyltransferase
MFPGVKWQAPGHGASGTSVDTVNREAWRQPATVRQYQRMEGWTDPGEQAAVALVTQRARGRPILDIGVGTGRTTPLLKAVSLDYTAVDYTPEMVQACRARHPGTRVEHMDARDLRAFADGQFALAVFSFNGIDAVDFADRHKVLHEVHRVLQPGGLFLVSAHNRLGPGVGEQPRLRVPFSYNPARLAWRIWKLARSLAPSWRNHRRLQALNESHDNWAMLNAGAHDFGIVVMYTTLAEQKRQLEAAGFEVEQVLESARGSAVTQAEDTRDAWWLHYIARKPGACGS